MSRNIDLTGQTFSRLTAVEAIGSSKGGGMLWRCTCSCGGSEVTVVAHNLRRGNTQSCGCLNREQSGARVRTHGQSETRLYEIWRNIIRRTTNANHGSYPDYGGRGIAMSPEWRRSFEAFAQDMGPTYRDGLSIDRIDVNGDYEPSNCRWATSKEQARNMRTNRLVTAFGQTKPLAEWAELRGLNYQTLYNRLTRSGWSIERALTAQPPNDGRRSR